MRRSAKGRALFYTRDSGGKHETTPGQYVAWAVSEATKLGVSFDGTPDAIESMMRNRVCQQGDVLLDFGVAGNVMSRPALDKLFDEVCSDLNVSHILIPRRDRFARPDHPHEALALEFRLRRDGVTLVFMDRVVPPLPPGQRAGIEDLLAGIIDYDRAGKDRADLAQKIIYAHRTLAEAGFSTGGRAPYGFRRWLAKDDGVPVRELAEGERVRMRGHHVVWLPTAEHEIAVIRRILELLAEMPATRVAAMLTAEGIPTPDAGRKRRDNGVEHRTSGVWNQTTIVNIARNPLLRAISTYGRRSMGDQRRHAANGPRLLDSCDFRPDEKPKVVRNQEEDVIRASAHFAPVVETEKHQELLATLNQRGASQRGKPRSRNPELNPLGSRVFDMACGWPMYRSPYNGSYRYTCGYYTQSHGQQCEHNHINGPAATQFVLQCLAQRLLSPKMLAKLRAALEELARKEAVAHRAGDQARTQKRSLAQIENGLATASRNFALAASDFQREACAQVLEEFHAKKKSLEAEIASNGTKAEPTFDSQHEVAAALGVLDRLPEFLADPTNLAGITKAFRLVNARLFLRFQKLQPKKRTINVLACGLLTFGNAPPPVPLYAGPTGRRAMSANSAAVVAASSGGDDPPPNRLVSGREGMSLGNVSRGDRI